MFKKFQNKFKDIQNTVSNNLTSESPVEEHAGLICPMCMKRYSTVDSLQLCNAKCLSLINQSTYQNTNAPGDSSIDKLKEEKNMQETFPTNNKTSTVEISSLNLEQDTVARNDSSIESSKSEQTALKSSIEAMDAFETLQEGDNSKFIPMETSLNLEIEDLKKLLEEERLYSGELKDELKSFKTFKDQMQIESEAFEKQIKISLETNEELARQKEECVNKYNDIAQQQQEFENTIKRIELEKKSQQEKLTNQAVELEKASNWIRNLESQLVQRPGADDVLVLKKELVRVQQIMYEMSQNEEERINQKFTEYQLENEQLKVEKLESSKYHEAKQAEVIKQSENIESASSKTLFELEQKLQTEKNLVNHLKEENEKLCEDKKKLNFTIESLKNDDQKEILELKSKIEEINKENDQITSKLLTSSEKISISEKNYIDKDNELTELRTLNEGCQLELNQANNQIKLKMTQMEKLTELLEKKKLEVF